MPPAALRGYLIDDWKRIPIDFVIYLRLYQSRPKNFFLIFGHKTQANYEIAHKITKHAIVTNFHHLHNMMNQIS